MHTVTDRGKEKEVKEHILLSSGSPRLPLSTSQLHLSTSQLPLTPPPPSSKYLEAPSETL